jgi:hypothetical protein
MPAEVLFDGDDPKHVCVPGHNDVQLAQITQSASGVGVPLQHYAQKRILQALVVQLDVQTDGPWWQVAGDEL